MNTHAQLWKIKHSLSTMGKPYCHDRIHYNRALLYEALKRGWIDEVMRASLTVQAAKERIIELNTANGWEPSADDIRVLSLPPELTDDEIKTMYEHHELMAKIRSARL